MLTAAEQNESTPGHGSKHTVDTNIGTQIRTHIQTLGTHTHTDTHTHTHTHTHMHDAHTHTTIHTHSTHMHDTYTHTHTHIHTHTPPYTHSTHVRTYNHTSTYILYVHSTGQRKRMLPLYHNQPFTPSEMNENIEPPHKDSHNSGDSQGRVATTLCSQRKTPPSYHAELSTPTYVASCLHGARQH